MTGQDATPTGVQYIIAGWQAGTVYKSIKVEAAAAAQAAINIVKGKAVKTNGKVSGTPSILLTPVWITKHSVSVLFKDGFVTKVYSPDTVPKDEQTHCFGGAKGFHNWAGEAVDFFDGVLGIARR